MLVSDLFQLSLSYTYLKCVVREELATNPFRRVVFYKDSLRLSFHDQNKIPTWIQTLSWRFHLQSTVYIKEADPLMRAGNDGEHKTALVETLRARTRESQCDYLLFLRIFHGAQRDHYELPLRDADAAATAGAAWHCGLRFGGAVFADTVVHDDSGVGGEHFQLLRDYFLDTAGLFAAEAEDCADLLSWRRAGAGGGCDCVSRTAKRASNIKQNPGFSGAGCAGKAGVVFSGK